MGQDGHAIGYDQAILCLLLITNMMALSIFTELPQYFITDFFRPRNVYGPSSKATSHSSSAFKHPLLGAYSQTDT